MRTLQLVTARLLAYAPTRTHCVVGHASELYSVIVAPVTFGITAVSLSVNSGAPVRDASDDSNGAMLARKVGTRSTHRLAATRLAIHFASAMHRI